MDEIRYKVLWIDDDETIHEAYQQLADLHGIDLVTFTNWEEARPVFEADFDEWTAVVLDAFCQLTSEPVLDQHFLNEVVGDLKTKFAERRKLIPWYVLSAGTMEKFEDIISSINLSDRRKLEQDWGKLVFLKDEYADEIALFNAIRKVGEKMSINTVLYRHKELFKYVGVNTIFGADARRILLDSLSVLYFPEEKQGVIYTTNNPLMQILEIVLRSMIEKGLLPDECMNDKGPIVKKCCELLLGETVEFQEKSVVIKMDHKYPLGQVPELMKLSKDYRNTGSHPTEDKSIFIITNDKRESFFGYLMQLCHIIIEIGSFIEKHPDIESNKLNFIKTEYSGKPLLLEQDKNGNLHCGIIIMPKGFVGKVGEIVQIEDVEKNNSPKLYERYKFRAKSAKIVSNTQNTSAQ